MATSRVESRVENLVTWFAASVLTAAAVIYAMKRDDDRHKAQAAFGAATPATEPLVAAGGARPRAGPRAQGHDAGAYPMARLEGHLHPHLSRDPGRPAPVARRRRRVLFAGRAVSGDRGGRLGLCVLFQRGVDRRPSVARRRHRSRRLARSAARGDHPHGRPQRRQADLRLPDRLRHRTVERECRDESDLRRAQHHLRRGREARHRLAQPGVAVLHILRHRRHADRRWRRGGVPAGSRLRSDCRRWIRR